MFGLSDLAALLAAAAVGGFFIWPVTRGAYEQAYGQFPALISFVKFAILATAGEMLAHRIRAGGTQRSGRSGPNPGRRYLPKNFGLLPKMLVWGLIGAVIYWIFVIFSSGVRSAFPGAFEITVLGMGIPGAFLISLFMNVFFAPVMMLSHNLTDRFISANRGRFPISRWNTRELLEGTDWSRMWSFVFARTIPLFWIPAHTVTFLLPENYRTLFAALLSVALGLILAFAVKGHHSPTQENP
jgi:hypothetical protein